MELEERRRYSGDGRQGESIVEQQDRRRYSRPKRQEDHKIGGEYWGKRERGGYSWGLGDWETGRQGDRKTGRPEEIHSHGIQ